MKAAPQEKLNASLQGWINHVRYGDTFEFRRSLLEEFQLLQRRMYMSEEMMIFTRTYDFVSWLLPLAEKFPRSQRFVVTQRLQNAALNFQELIIEANTLRGSLRMEK